jgi:uncharacterized protein YkwD
MRLGVIILSILSLVEAKRKCKRYRSRAPAPAPRTVQLPKSAPAPAPAPKTAEPTIRIQSLPNEPAPAPRQAPQQQPAPGGGGGSGFSAAGVTIPANLLSNPISALRFAVPKVHVPRTANFESDCLSLHNSFRALLGLRPMSFNQAARNVAVKVANDLARRRAFEHSRTPGFGENLYKVFGGGTLDGACAPAVIAWFNEFPLYTGVPIGRGDFTGYGHYTQMAWPDSTSVGCASARNSDQIIVVCEYAPPGNVLGYRLNVQIGATTLVR